MAAPQDKTQARPPKKMLLDHHDSNWHAMAGAMTRPSQDAARVAGRGREPVRSPVVPQLDEDPFNRDKNPKRRKTEAAVDLSIVDHLTNRVCVRFGFVPDGPGVAGAKESVSALQKTLSKMWWVLSSGQVSLSSLLTNQ